MLEHKKTTFQEYIKELPELLARLQKCTPMLRSELHDIPEQEVYVFYENGRAIFAGRSDGLRVYLMSQGRPGSTHNNAPSAFKLAKEEAIGRGYEFQSANTAIHDEMFIPFFAAAKERVAKMRIRFVATNDPVQQQILAIYAAVELKTQNEFDTH